MIKKIHMIKLGGQPTLSDTEMENVKSFKSLYPDFEFKIWRDPDCFDWIDESPFASYHYCKTRVMAYVADYLRCKILYEEGGLYVDTDVFAVNRIPDSYFEKSFTAWDPYGRASTNNGTCFYACEPKLPLFKEFCDVMSNSAVKVEAGDIKVPVAMSRIDEVLKKHGLDFKSEEVWETDQENEEFRILNRSQFGARHKDRDGYVTYGKTVYLTHACSGSWVTPSYCRYVNLKYAIIDKNTDMKVLEERLKYFIRKHERTRVIVFLLADEINCENLLDITEPIKNRFRTYILPIGGNKRGNAMDYILHRIADIKSCHDIMREDYCG